MHVLWWCAYYGFKKVIDSLTRSLACQLLVPSKKYKIVGGIVECTAMVYATPENPQLLCAAT